MTTLEILLKNFGPIVTQNDLALIFKKHVQTIRLDIKAKKMPFISVTEGEPRYKLSDVAEFIDGTFKPTDQLPKRSGKGRKVGSRNKIKQECHEETLSMSM